MKRPQKNIVEQIQNWEELPAETKDIFNSHILKVYSEVPFTILQSNVAKSDRYLPVTVNRKAM